MIYYFYFWLFVKFIGNFWNVINCYSIIVIYGKLWIICELKVGFFIILVYICLFCMMNYLNKEEIFFEMFSVVNIICVVYLLYRLNMFVCVNMWWEIMNNLYLMYLSYIYVWF